VRWSQQKALRLTRRGEALEAVPISCASALRPFNVRFVPPEAEVASALLSVSRPPPPFTRLGAFPKADVSFRLLRSDGCSYIRGKHRGLGQRR
jgi:hypothetical protein